jgi:deoxyribonuclease-4
MSISGGVFNALLHAEKAGCRTVQLFNKSSNQWAAKPLGSEEIERFHQEARRTGIAPVVSHTAYLINCASPDTHLYKRSVGSLGIEYARCGVLGIDFLVMHPGAHTGSGVETGIKRIAQGINRVFDKHPDVRTVLCLEATSGAGSIIGGRFEELQAIIDRIEDSSRVAVCLDTCHIFSAGYDIRTETAYRTVMDQFDSIIGLERIKVWHFNDSKGELGSRKDRHEHIGRGLIGSAAFGFILRDPSMGHVPKILETAKIENDRDMDKANLALLRRLAKRKTKKRNIPSSSRYM